MVKHESHKAVGDI